MVFALHSTRSLRALTPTSYVVCMRVVLTTVGSYGDVIPFAAIAEALRARGHDVRACSFHEYEPLFSKRRIEFVAAGGQFDLAGYTRRVIQANLYGGNPGLLLQSAFHLFIAFEARRRFEQCRAAMADADAVVCNALDLPAQAAATSLGVPWFVWTSKPVDRQTLPLSDAHFAAWDRKANQLIEQETGVCLGARAFRNLSPYETYFGVSPALLPEFEPPAGCFLTGTCFLGDYVPQVPREVREFLDSGPAPLIVTFGAFGELLPSVAFDAILEAVRRTGVRAIVHSASRASAAAPSAELLFASCLPYAAVFPRARAVLHHGGAGTAAEVCRAGLPSATLCYIDTDQAYWAAQLHRLGVGTEPLMLRELRVDALSERLTQVLNDEQLRERANALAPLLASEDGAAHIVARLEAFLQSPRRRDLASSEPSGKQREGVVHGPEQLRNA